MFRLINQETILLEPRQKYPTNIFSLSCTVMIYNNLFAMVSEV